MNSDKCNVLISGKKFEHLWTKIDNNRIWKTEQVKLLIITIDNELKIDEDLNNVFQKTNGKLSALTRIKNTWILRKQEFFLKEFLKSSSNIALLCECFILEEQVEE